MDKKTMERVINNMAEKIEALETNMKELEQKANRTGQFHLDAINEKFNYFDKLERLGHDAWLEDNKKIEALENKIKTLEKINLLNAERNTKYMEHFEKMADSIDKLNERCDIQTKCDSRIIECLDDIEAKNYQIKSDLDRLIENNEGGNNE